MKPLILICLTGLAVLSHQPPVADAQEGFVLIVNRSNPTVKLESLQISKLFLRKVTTWPDGRPVQPVDQVVSSATRRRFSGAIHHMDVPSVKGYWQELVFSGRGEPPPERASDEEVLLYVQTNPNAIGYVSPTTPLDDVRVMTVAESHP
jgi:ABC-type phosphate transport system substrate-binding protein